MKIIDDVTAELEINKFKEYKEDAERVISLCDKMIAEYKARVEEEQEKLNDYYDKLKYVLDCYMDTVNVKETKTQVSYKLASAKLVRTKPKQTIEKDDSRLINEVDEQYIKTTHKIDWAEFKKVLEISGDKVINKETGEIVEGCSVTEKAGEFQIKF